MINIQVTKVLEVQQETKTVKTLTFYHSEPVKPGQFYMVWIPGIDEIPMSVSIIHHDQKGITFRKVGIATEALFRMKPNDAIGIRGPFGSSLSLEGNHLFFVGGGTGIAMLAPAIEMAREQGKQVTVVLGAKTKSDLFFKNRIRNTGATLEIATDDGSQGFLGLASELAKQLLQQEDIDAIITCGPELMMKQLLDISKNIPFQASLERYLKCAIGLCGQCCIGEGLRVCKEGPIFNGKTLKNVKDFGKYRRDSAGRKIPL